MIEIPAAVYAAFDGTLETRVAAFMQALEEHRFTVGVPAPVEDPLVEAIARAGGMAVAQILDEDGAPVAARVVPTLAFRRRFTLEERAAITLAASQALERGDATLQVWLDDLSASREVDLDHPDTLAGMAALVAAELISELRAAEILA